MPKNQSFIKQHIVPVVYLKRFATKGNSAYRINVLCNKKQFTNSIENVGWIENYYDVDDDDNKKWEHFYSKNIEPLYGSPLDKIIAEITLSPDNKIILNNEKKQLLSTLIISQWLRVPDFIDENLKELPSILNQIKKTLLSQLKGKINQADKSKIMRYNCSAIHGKDIILSYINSEDNLKRYTNALNSRLWQIYYNPYYTTIPFITSDNPVVAINMDTLSIKRRDNGIGNNKTAIFFPLSPRIIVALYPFSIKKCIPYMNGKKNILKEEDKNFISTINQKICEQSYKEVFMPLNYSMNIKK